MRRIGPGCASSRMRARCGQSAAVRTGVAAARGDIVATLDGDGQNDPAFLPQLIETLEAGAPAPRARRRPAAGPHRHAAEAVHVARRQPHPQRGCFARPSARHRLRPEGVPPRHLPGASLFRRPAPLHAAAASNARDSRSPMSTSSTGRVASAGRTIASGIGCGSASPISSACSGSSAAEDTCPSFRRKFRMLVDLSRAAAMTICSTSITPHGLVGRRRLYRAVPLRRALPRAVARLGARRQERCAACLLVLLHQRRAASPRLRASIAATRSSSPARASASSSTCATCSSFFARAPAPSTAP